MDNLLFSLKEHTLPGGVSKSKDVPIDVLGLSDGL